MKSLMSFIPMILSLAIATFIFIPINKSLKLSDKISKIIPTTPKFKPLFFCGMYVFTFTYNRATWFICNTNE